jgi:aspartate/tyrosine/aromatic aminotransferase
MLEVLKTIPAGDIVVLHGCCHNPTGMDPAPEQWQAMAEVAAEAGWLPLFDFAYQGLADGIEQDAAGLRCFVNTVPEILVCSSFSKNFGLYAERAGALTVAAGDAEAAQKAHGHIKRCLRALHSFSPAHGGQLVRLVLDDPELRSSWEKELTEMRERINGMRSLLVQKLEAAGVEQDFSFIAGQRGMFSFPGLTKEQVARLRDEFSIYIVGSGRINVAGINEANIDRLVSAIQAVL